MFLSERKEGWAGVKGVRYMVMEEDWTLDVGHAV